jgi:hypothetical protein
VSLKEILPITIASLSLLVSVVTAWLTLVRRGKVKMTRPAIVAFAFDNSTPKVFLRFLLYSTAQRGNVIEGMYVVVAQGAKRSLFSFWGYPDSRGNMVRGSGLFVGREGIANDHHFVRVKQEAAMPVEAGICTVSVYASVLNQSKDELLHSVRLNFSEGEAARINNPKDGVIYDLNPETKEYRAEVR